MSYKFSVGEIAIFIASANASPGTKPYSGQECTVDRPLGSHYDKTYGAMYGIEFPDGAKAYCAPSCLRKRRPPEQKADDDFCEWLKGIVNPSLEESMKTAQKNLASYTQEGSCG